MLDVIIDTIIDAIKLIPFLFIAFLFMEYLEHKFNKKNKDKITKAGTFGPLLGSILGAVPQCGFSVMATNLYATRIISLGTLISIYLSTSDEMLPILISEKADATIILKILLLKVLVGIAFGFIIDAILRTRKNKVREEIKDFCEEEHCDCNHGIVKSSLKHTLNVILFVIIITFILNIGMNYLGEEKIGKLFLKDNLLAPFVSSLIGLIPNCGASVILTELYLKGVISFASCIAGLLTGSGVALLVLFKVNKNRKENIKIILLLYFIGSIFGILLEILKLL